MNIAACTRRASSWLGSLICPAFRPELLFLANTLALVCLFAIVAFATFW